jgi:hypothetical protein
MASLLAAAPLLVLVRPVTLALQEPHRSTSAKYQ